MKIDEKLNELGIKTNEELNKLYTSIFNTPRFVELFHKPLEDLLQKILKASGACFKKSIQWITKNKWNIGITWNSNW